MDLQKAKILLEKINSLHKSMSADPRNVSTIEKDLMRSYVRQLYECFLDLPAAATAPESPAVEIIKSTPRTPVNRPEPSPTQPVSHPEPSPPPPLELKRPAPPLEEVAPPPPPPVVVQAPPKPVPAAPPPPPPKPVETSTPPPMTGNDDLDDLFAFANAKELSEKLANQPIADLRKAMGLNERIFTVNELFGGDQNAFDTAMSNMNQFGSFEEAKQYMIRNVAGKYGWAEKEKKNKAKIFVKLVKRRYP